MHDDKTCAQAQSDAYQKGWRDASSFAAQQAEARLSKRAQRTSRQAVARNADAIKGIQREIYNLLEKTPSGYTDFDLEDVTGRSHQSVSAARNALMTCGLVMDSGETRKNARGNASIVWVLSTPEVRENDDRRTTDDSGTDNADGLF